MTHEEVLKVVLREMLSIGQGWRLNWGDFDGRTLRSQLNSIDQWAEKAISSNETINYTDGTEFYSEQAGGL